MSEGFRYYAHSNGEIIGIVATLNKVEGDLFWMKLDRKAGTVTNELTGIVYDVPASVVLT